MKNYFKIVSLLLIVMVLSCTNNKEKKYHRVIEKIKDLEKDSIEYTIKSTDFFDTEQFVLVETKETSFYITNRKAKIKKFKCSECHSKSISELKMTNLKGQKAHSDINLKHASLKELNCNSCHPTQNLDNLKSNLDAPVDFNQSYKVCAQCHSTQYKDWLGGAHGKRVKGWVNPRISHTCVDCHNPHNPKFEVRYPARFNSKYSEQRK